MKKTIFILFFLFPSFLVVAEDYYWMDGDRRLSLVQEPGLAADFLNDEFELQTQEGLRGIHKEYPALVLYRLESDSLTEAEQFFATADPALSPVFAERGGGVKALPGGVIILFKPGKTREEMEDFLAAEGIAARAREAAWHKRGYIIEAPPGLSSLHLANRLAARKDIVAISSPDWWSDTYTNR